MWLDMWKTKFKPQRKLGGGESKVCDACLVSVCYTVVVTLDTTTATATPKSPRYFSLLLKFEEKDYSDLFETNIRKRERGKKRTNNKTECIL